MGTPIPVVICDDSRLARRQMARALSQWNVKITETANGLEALEAIRAGKGELLFLDLNMPLMDGYEVLARIRSHDLPTMTVVVSGDIQPSARERVMQQGALDFIRKPIDMEKLSSTLHQFGLLEALDHTSTSSFTEAPDGTFQALGNESEPAQAAIALRDSYQELSNVAMGEAANLLAQLLDTFIELPVPRIQVVDACELNATLEQTFQANTLTTVCQGFIAPGISGEALLSLSARNADTLARLLSHEGQVTEQVERELVMDIANVLIGAFLNGLGCQLDLRFTQGSPLILRKDNLQQPGKSRARQKALSVDINYRIEGHEINCDLMMLFTEDSLSALNELVRHL
ncbi:response regulator [Marinobacterium alkalitolerans]|nr:response regulator [Marinobacterium alkalitolerans]